MMKPSLVGGYCAAGAQYPCYMPIEAGYTASELEDQNTINLAIPSYKIAWPEATAGGHKGDTVAVQCYVTGGTYTAPPLGGTGSTDWYEIAVPVSNIPSFNLALLEHPDTAGRTPVTTFNYNGVQSVNGWAPIVYFNELTPSPSVPACKNG